MGLSIEQLTQSQRIAGMLGLDTNQSCMGVITDWRHCTYASCAMRALEAVRMALAGFEGPAEIYEGEAGINRFLPHGDRFLDPPPDLTSVVFKRWPALVFCQTPMDVALEAAGKVNDLGSINSIKVYTYKKAIETAGTKSSFRPVSRAGRTHSIPYCVAVALVKKTVEYEYFDDGFIEKEEQVAGLIPRITVVEDAAMTKAYPDKTPCRIMVTLKDGTIIDESHDYPHGDPRDPLSDSEIEVKALKYLSSLIDHEAASTIIERVWKLESEASIDWLVGALKQRA
jgi:2-methylcitrate dehydratase